MSDFNKPFLDISTLLPLQYRDKALVASLKNIFNRQLTKPESTSIYGYVGAKSTENSSIEIPHLSQPTPDRTMNELQPVIYSKHGTEENIFTFNDILNKLALLGVNVNDFGNWGKSQSFNFIPPIDIDKFCNYNRYFWVGHLCESIAKYDLITDDQLNVMVPSPQKITPEFRRLINNLRKAAAATGFSTEYFDADGDAGKFDSGRSTDIISNERRYVDMHGVASKSNIWTIKHDLGFNPRVLSVLDTEMMVYVDPMLVEYPDEKTIVITFAKDIAGIVRLFAATPDEFIGIEYGFNKDIMPEYYQIKRGGTTDWSINNFWVHESDLDTLGFSRGLARQATRPIIEYVPSLERELNAYSLNGNPSTYGTPYVQTKTKLNQLPLFNLYRANGDHAEIVSSIFFFSENPSAPIDGEMNRRIAVDAFGDYLFEHGTFDKTANEDLFFKINEKLTSIWHPGEIISPKYVKKDMSGSMINLNKIDHYSSYYWYGHLIDTKPIFNPIGVPEYTVIERGGNSGWSTGNYWAHADFIGNLPYHKNLLIRAQRPIIEFNLNLESELATTSLIKNEIHQTPKFNIYDEFGTFLMGGVLLEHYEHIVSSNDWLFSRNDVTYLTDLLSNDSSGSNIVRYFKISNVLKNYTSFSAIFSPEVARNIECDPASGEGAWLIPDQLTRNISNTNKDVIKQGDLHTHFISVIQSQHGFTGSSFGSNNFRQLENVNLGLGGNIKRFNGDWNLFIGLINQNSSTPLGLIEFLKLHYDSFLNSISEYVLQYLPDIITNNEHGMSDLDKLIFDQFINFYNNDSQVSLATSSSIDDNVARLFYDSLSAIRNCVITLPYLGLCDAVKPELKFDNVLGFDVVVHHDGHVSRASKFDLDYIKKIVNKNFVRSNNQTLPGIVTANIYPTNPFKGQMWFNTVTNKLSYFNVRSDSFSVEPTHRFENDYWYDRDTNVLRKCVKTYNGFEYLLYWEDTYSINEAWVELSVENLINNLVLNVEKTLFNGCSIFETKKLDINKKRNENVVSFDSMLEIELLKFGSKYNIDVYSSNYDPSNAFTWNYKNVDIPYTSRRHSTWREIYKDMYGTERPNLEPWVMLKMEKNSFMGSLFELNITPFSIEMWDLIKQQIKIPLSVNIETNELLPPYVNPSLPVATEAVLHIVPQQIEARYIFGDMGYVEATWRKSIEYNYSLLSTYFKLDPINFIKNTWGYHAISINDYEINAMYGRKLSQRDLILHGEKNTDLSQNGDILNLSYPMIIADQEFVVEVISDFDKVFSVSEKTAGYLGHGKIGSDFNSDIVHFKLIENSHGLKIGDKFVISLSDAQDSATIKFIPTPFYKINGLNQAYVQYSRSLSNDVNISTDYSLLTNWDMKLGYRFSGLVNTNSLKVKSDAFEINKNNFNIFIKENKNYRYLQLTALRIQLVKKGSSYRKNDNDIPQTIGEDWVYRIENFNRKNPFITVYEYDKSGPYQTFGALSKRNVDADWRQYLAPTGIKTYSAPFLITGIQNVVDFIFGYAKKLESDGWVFNNDEDPNIDADTGRAAGWQLDIEKFIDFQYRGVDAGAGVIINPFINRVWLNVPHGMVTDFTRTNDTYDSMISQNICDIDQVNIDFANIKIFRDDEQTEIDSSVPIFSINALISEYEHVALFDDYTSNGDMLYDQFLGINVQRLLLQGETQVKFNGRISYGGNYVLNHELHPNIESSVSGILDYYDSNMMVIGSKTAKHARGLIGYDEPKYLESLGISEKTSFSFWKSMIHNKGSNFSVDAFINSSRYKSAVVDEYWAYKLAEFGDSRPKMYPEIKLESYMSRTQFTKFQFIDSSYDIDEPIMGFIPIYQDDDNMWFTLDDIHSHQYFTAKVTANIPLTVVADKQYYDLSVNGKPVFADHVEIYVDNLIIETEIAGFDTAPIDDNALYLDSSYRLLSSDLGYELINSSTLKISNASLVGKNIIVRCFGPNVDVYNPAKIIDYRNNVVVYDNMILWDPARGIHTPDAIEIVDIVSEANPAKYNYSTRTVNNPNYDVARPWGDREIGKVWWNTKNLDYIPYFDAKIFPDANERISRWGALSDSSTIELAEWTEATVPPESYIDEIENQKKNTLLSSNDRYSGEPAFKELYSRNRSWRHRPIAWKYSKNQLLQPMDFLTSDVIDITLLSSKVGASIAALSKGRFASIGIDSTSSFSLLNASTQKPIGEAKVINDEYCILGTGENPFSPGIVMFDIMYFTSVNVTINDDPLSPIKNNLGKIIFGNEVDAAGKRYVVVTCLDAGVTQKLEITSLQSTDGSLVTFNFYSIGITISGKTTGHWSMLSDEERIRVTAIGFGNSNNDVCVYSAVSVNVIVPFIDKEMIDIKSLPGNSNPIEHWIAWATPSSSQLVNDSQYPYNNWEPLYGNFTEIGSNLVDVQEMIITELKDQKIHNKQIVSRYDYTWGNWVLLDDIVRMAKFNESSTFAEDNFSFDIQINTEQIFAYKNGMFISADKYIITRTDDKTVISFGIAFNRGDNVKIIIRRVIPSTEELLFDPATLKADDKPLKLKQYKYDYQYTSKKIYDKEGKLINTLYYYWVKNKNVTSMNRDITLQLAAQLLRNNTGSFAILEGLKPKYDELPTRYTQFIIYGLNQIAKKDATYKLRFTNNSTLRDDCDELNLKNVHTEWTLIKESQKSKIPKQLWTLLTNAACGSNEIGEKLPSDKRIKFDKDHGTRTRFGFGPDQIFVDTELVIGSIKNTIINTKLKMINQSNGGIEVSDRISFSGFNVNLLDDYFSTPEKTRVIMHNIWENAKGTQINEIFFEVLYDALSENYEFTDIVKTSLLSVHSIKLINSVK